MIVNGETKSQPIADKTRGVSRMYFTFVTEQEELPQKSGTGGVKGDFQARFCGNEGVRLPCVTRLAVIVKTDHTIN